MRTVNEKGFTLVELLLAITIMGIIAGATMPLLTTILKVHSDVAASSSLYHEGLLIMERMTGGIRRSTYLLIPNNHTPVRDILAFSGTVNDDEPDDYYFGDPLFPRIDEDPKKQMTDDGKAGIIGIDDDGDGTIDEGVMNDDDEDGLDGQDPFDGIDNDGDGNIDEDTNDDANIPGMDDDGDGEIDEGDTKDDDEDGAVNEDPLNPIIYSFDIGTNTLAETSTFDSTTTNLSTRVTAFTATYEPPDAANAPKVLISLTLTEDDGESITFSEYVYPRNILQKTGKRVR